MSRARISFTRVVTLTVALAAVAACDRGEIAEDSARLATDTMATTAEPTPAGPLPTVPGEDAELVMAATEYEITSENFERFLRASEALSYLRARDAQVRSLLERAGGTSDTSANSLLDQLEAHPQISQAITSAGMSVRDYYVMAIALAAAQRYSANPESAPPTPVGRKNAEWVRGNQAQVARLRTWGAAVAQ